MLVLGTKKGGRKPSKHRISPLISECSEAVLGNKDRISVPAGRCFSVWVC